MDNVCLVNEGRRQEAGGRFCHEDLYPVPKTFRLKRRGFRPDCFDKGVAVRECQQFIHTRPDFMIDFEPWDKLLRQYVDQQGRVNYAAWKTEQPQVLVEWLSSQKKSPLKSNINTLEKLALWINLYNALTISSILERYPLDSILPNIFGVPNWLAFLWFFQRRVYCIFGQRYSLAQIENQILRNELQEPRIHFAIVCASVGCPLLRSGAYFPEQVMQQLDEDAYRFINNPQKVHYDFHSQTLYCNKIFKWYRQDFLKIAPSIPEYISSYLKIDVPLTAATPISYLEYDWSLNQRIS